MMPRTVPEWIARTDDAMPSPKVTLRIFARAKGYCQSCNRKLMAGEKWIRDHIVPLADGGENRERNLQILCAPCSTLKTSTEATERAKVRAMTKAAYGIRTAPKRKLQGAGFPRTRAPRAPKPTFAGRRVLYRTGQLSKPLGGEDLVD